MRSFSAFAVLVALPAVFAHYNFESLIVNGEGSKPYQYVRRTTNANSPIEDVTSPNIICNAGGIDDAIMAVTETKQVAAGDQIGFKVNSNLGHPGPLAMYMSRAPTTAQEYKGDGDWFKVYELTTDTETADGVTWASFVNGGVSNVTFTLPAELPAGQYLLRAEHIGLHGAGTFGGAQFYIGCAQIEVTGSGAGTPGPTVKFPGAYDGNEPGILIGIYWPPLTNYQTPGPVTWPNACIDHTVNVDGQETDGDCNPLGGGASPPPASGNNGNTTPLPASSAAPAPPASSSTAAVPVATPAPTEEEGEPVTSAVPAPAPSSSAAPAPAPQPSTKPCKKRKARRNL